MYTISFYTSSFTSIFSAVTYQVTVITGNQPGSATDADVYLAIYGEQGDTGKRALIKSDKDEKFQEGQVGNKSVIDVLCNCINGYAKIELIQLSLHFISCITAI